MTPLPRRVCPICAKDVAVRVNGALREHVNPSTGKTCAGSGKGGR